jgi:hypothetical protein
MNKTAIKNFAIWARNKLIADITYKAGLLGITEKEIKNPLPQSTPTVQFFDIGTKEPYSITGVEIEQRRKLAEEIQRKVSESDYKTAYKNLVEEVAYTWFNRLIAVRFMEVNDYLPTHVRVLSSESDTKSEPDLVTNPMDVELNYTPYEKDRIMQLKNDNQMDELFCMLFIKQCNALNAILPELFEKTNDYTELLMKVSFTDLDGVVYHLVHDISEDDFKEAVEIIGWMYQYYISEKHEETVSAIGKKVICKEDIPAATQLFTTDWVVRYMVDNSLGRYWVERNPKSKLKEKLEYFVTPKSGEIQTVDEKTDPKDLTFFDPCMGSGHILVYAFDVLMEIYRECGYSDRDATLYILTDNLYGLDIDDRAYQLAYFAVMMKARSYNRRILNIEISPNLCAIQESNSIKKFSCDGVTTDGKQNEIGEYLVHQFRHAKEIGSLQTVAPKDYNSLQEYLGDCVKAGQVDIFTSDWFDNTVSLMYKLTKQAKILSKSYAIVATNPPYMNNLESHLKDFVTKQYKLYSGDLFSVFMYRNFGFCNANGYSAFMTPNVWMFIKTYENLREYIIKNKSISTLVQMAKGAFFKEATVDICAYVLRNNRSEVNGTYIRLDDFKGDMEVQKKKVIEAIADKDCGYFYETNAKNFSKIPSMPIAYWASEQLINDFRKGTRMDELVSPRQGLATADNNRFLRQWYEVKYEDINFEIKNIEECTGKTTKWVPYNKGGAYRKWYGNYDYVINWENDGFEIRNFKDSNGKQRSVIRNPKFYFKEAITWSDITSGGFSLRYREYGSIHDVTGMSAFSRNLEELKFLLGLMNTKLADFIFSILNPTLHLQIGNFCNFPVISNGDLKSEIVEKVNECIDLCKNDWNSSETAWGFKKNVLLKNKNSEIKDSLDEYEIKVCKSIDSLKNNEEYLNEKFISLYNLQDEFDNTVLEKDITIKKVDKKENLKSFISYAVGCMFGRYSLDVDGLAYAGGEWDDGKYSIFIPDRDNILPITDEEYFEDDIVGLFCAFLKKTFGAETLEENLDFIAKALGKKGNSSREIIRNYFLKDFFKDHCKVYQRRPIYWLFDSGKSDGFKALVYMHRYDENTIGNLRIDYLHRMQHVYENEICRMQETIDNSKDAREVSAATKRKEKLVKQLKETKEYDEKIAHLALARIAINLDDGVKVNYEKVQTGTDSQKLEVLAKI